MSSTIPRLVNIYHQRKLATIDPKLVDKVEVNSDGETHISKKIHHFATNCKFRSTVFHNHNHFYNIARYDCTCADPLEKDPEPFLGARWGSCLKQMPMDRPKYLDDIQIERPVKRNVVVAQAEEPEVKE